jgi:hypothetical protein
VAVEARRLLQSELGEWPEVTERAVRLYQERQIVSPACGGTRGAYYTPRHVLQAAIGALGGRIRDVGLKGVELRAVATRSEEGLGELLRELLSHYRAARAVGPPRPLPSLVPAVAAGGEGAAVVRRLVVRLASGVEISFPWATDLLDPELPVRVAADLARTLSESDSARS